MLYKADNNDLTASRPNGGVRRAIGEALVQFQLSDPDITKRRAAVEAIARGMEASQLEPLQASIEGEMDPALKATKGTLYKYIKNVKSASEGCVTDE